MSDLQLLPNGWPQPTFMGVSDDGSLYIEWHRREGLRELVCYSWDPGEGPQVIKTWGPINGKVHQESEEDPEEVLAKLDEWLR